MSINPFGRQEPLSRVYCYPVRLLCLRGVNHDNVIHPSSYAQREYRDTLFQCICVYCICKGATSHLYLWRVQLSPLQPNHNQPIHTSDTAGSHSTTLSHPSPIHPHPSQPAMSHSHTHLPNLTIIPSYHKLSPRESLTEEGARACVWLIVCLIMPMCTYVSVYVCAGECVRG